MMGPMNTKTPRPSIQVKPAETVKAVSAEQLLGAARVVVIEHKGELYELRLTRNDKLILTK